MCALDKIKRLDKAIKIVEMPLSEKAKNIHLKENINVKSAPTITRQPDHKAEDLDTDNVTAKTKHIANKLAKDKNQH